MRRDNQKIKLLIGRHAPIKKFWVHNNVFKSIFFDSASVLIPSVEEYIVNLLLKKRDEIKNEKIKNELELLVEEEHAHYEVHNMYNQMLEREGYKIKKHQDSIIRLRHFWIIIFQLGHSSHSVPQLNTSPLVLVS